MPPSAFTRHAFGIVRRGVLVRERCRPDGSHSAVDVAGPGAYVPLANVQNGAGYAASRVLLCVYPEDRVSVPPGQDRLALELMKLAEETLERVERLSEAKGRPSAAERIEALRAAVSEWLGPRGAEALLQRDLAALLSMRKETVCRVLRAESDRA